MPTHRSGVNSRGAIPGERPLRTDSVLGNFRANLPVPGNRALRRRTAFSVETLAHLDPVRTISFMRLRLALREVVELRRSRRIEATEVAAEMNATPTAVDRIESGEQISLDLADDYCAAVDRLAQFGTAPRYRHSS